jgi:dTDP-4-amino-4,6-dideoxygalactose transaminase
MGIELARILNLTKVSVPKGNLTPIQGGRDVPFDLRWIDYTLNLTAANVEVRVELDYYGLDVLLMFWRGLSNFSSMDAILEEARPRGIRVVEDAAQAHGAPCKGRPVGSLGDVASWSFYPAKNLAARGGAGAVTSDDPEVAVMCGHFATMAPGRSTSTRFAGSTAAWTSCRPRSFE